MSINGFSEYFLKSNVLPNNFHNIFKQRLQDQYGQFLTSESSSSLKNILLTKNNFKMSSYLTEYNNQKFRNYIANLRCNTSCLKTGLNYKFTKSETKCPCCESNLVEDIYHFAFSCTEYNDLRDQMYARIIEHIPYFRQLNSEDKMKRLLISPHRILKNCFETFIIKAYERRSQK